MPPWVKGDFPPKSNDSYYFMVAEGSGNTIREAQNDSDLALITNLMQSAGMKVSGSQIEKILINMHNDETAEHRDFTSQYSFTYDDVDISFKAVDCYWCRNANGIECKTLYEIANDPVNVAYEPVEYSNKYGARGLWRSILVPGWGQMYKHSYVKGSLILVTEISCVATAIVFENQRTSYVSKAHASFSADAIKFYQKKANNAKSIRNNFIIAASGIYLLNLVDAIATKGRLRYKNIKGKNLAINPIIHIEGSFGVSLAYTF